MDSSTKKIAFVGTLCCGKTTVFEKIKSEFAGKEGLIFLEEAARAYLAENKIDSGAITEDVQNKMQDWALRAEKIAHAMNPKAIVCDRSVLDSVAYAMAEGDFEKAERIFNRAGSWVKTYSKFILFDPSGVPYAMDDIRKESAEERDAVHRAFYEFLTERKLPFEIVSGSLEERLAAVRDGVAKAFSSLP